MRKPRFGCGPDIMFVDLCVLVALFLGGWLIIEHSRRPRLWSLVWWLVIVSTYYILRSYFGNLVGWCWML